MYKEPIQLITMRIPTRLLDSAQEFSEKFPWIAPNRSAALHYLIEKGIAAEAKKPYRAEDKIKRDCYLEAKEKIKKRKREVPPQACVGHELNVQKKG